MVDGRAWLGDPAARFLVLVLLVAVVWNLLGNLLLPYSWYVPANLAVAAVLVALARSAGLGWDQLGMRTDQIRRGVGIGLLAAAGVAIVLAIAIAIPPTEGLFEDEGVRVDSTFDRWFVPTVRIPLGTAIFEEVLFRSVLLGALISLYRTRTAVVVSAVLFGLWHIVPAGETANGSGFTVAGEVIGTVVLTTVGGLGFALLRVWARSLVAPILAHAATNSLAYIAAVVAIEAVD